MRWEELSPRERDALVAEEVMGWKRGTGSYTVIVPGPFDDCDCTSHDQEPPAFTDDIACAWEVVEKMREDGYYPDLISTDSPDGNKWYVRVDRFEDDKPTGYWNGRPAPSAPEAIALAALRAKGVEV